eukprot:2639821-Rhodomonas_salina.1
MEVDCPVPACTEKVKRYLLDSHIKDPEFSREHTEKLKAKIASLREDNRLLLVKTRENVAQRTELSKLCSTVAEFAATPTPRRRKSSSGVRPKKSSKIAIDDDLPDNKGRGRRKSCPATK